MIKELEEIRSQAEKELSVTSDETALDEWRIRYLGRRGLLTQRLRSLGELPLEERRYTGQLANSIKTSLEQALDERRSSIMQRNRTRDLNDGRVDVTLPGRPVPIGRLHPTTQMVNEICSAFGALGFQIVEGPEVEWDYYNFECLNIPRDHPARDMWNTLWVDHRNDNNEYPILLRTHTSPMQIRVMEKAEPPIRVVVPGRCYRYEATDATHESIFFQVEGLAIDKGITFADLKGTLYEFAKRIFGSNRRIRFRCDYFPFVEPGVDMSIDCFTCSGNGCRVCGESGWIEIMGAGMVHPNVLRRVGYDPEIYTGFAFGLGPERIAMLRYGIEDIRLFYSNDLRFLQQF